MLYVADMLRISEILENANGVRLRLDGILSAETYEDFETIFFRHRRDPMKMIILDMRGVTFIGEGAACKLARVGGARVRIVNCSPFVATLLETVARQD